MSCSAPTKRFFGLIPLLALMAPTPVLASSWTPSVTVNVSAGACGGSIGCSIGISDSSPSLPVTKNIGNSLPDGSYANATATASFGGLHIYSEAYRASGSDATASAEADMDDIIPASNIVAGSYGLNIQVTGAHSNVSGEYGEAAYAMLFWSVDDAKTGALLRYGQWESTDAAPNGLIAETISDPSGDPLELDVQFNTNTYSSWGVPVFADYSDTAKIYLTSLDGGPDPVGLSGHDYSLVAALPEPGTWALLVVGLGMVGAVLRRGPRQRLRAA